MENPKRLKENENIITQPQITNKTGDFFVESTVVNGSDGLLSNEQNAAGYVVEARGATGRAHGSNNSSLPCSSVSSTLSEIQSEIFEIPYSQPLNQTKKLQETTVVTAFNISITPRDLQALIVESKGICRWLNDNLINFYIQLLTSSSRQEKKKLLSLSSHCFQKFYADKKKENIKLTKQSLFDFDTVLIPVCHSQHWSLVAIKIKERRVRYFDSMGKSANSKTRNEMLKSFVSTILSQENKEKNLKFIPTEWLFRAESNVPQQTNAYDCGLFTCNFARSIILETWSSSENYSDTKLEAIRVRITKEITSCELIELDNNRS